MDSKANKLAQKLLREQQKRLKPGECQKYVRLVLDPSIEKAAPPLGRSFLEELKATQLKLRVHDLCKENCILWERNVGQRTLTLDGEPDAATSLSGEWERENQVVMLMSEQDFQSAVGNKTIDNFGEELRVIFPNYEFTVVILRDPKPKSEKYITALIQLQIMQQLTVLQLPSTTKEVVGMLQRYTKAIAEAPYKQQQSGSIDNFKRFLLNDKKDCVRIVGDSGYERLWQQHLNRLPLVTLTHAGTISSVYSCPKKLMYEYENNPAAILKVANLKIRRDGVAPLQTERRIGDMLSSKLYTLYNSRDPEALL